MSVLDCVFTNYLGSINCMLTEESYSTNLVGKGESSQRGFPETPETLPLYTLGILKTKKIEKFDVLE